MQEIVEKVLIKKLSIQDRVKSNEFGFWITVSAVVFQALHSQYVLKLVSSLGNIQTSIGEINLASWHSFGIATLISLAILWFTLRGEVEYAYYAAAFEVWMNLCYYGIFIFTQKEPPYYLLLIAIPSAIALPSILAIFAEQITDNKILKKKEFNILSDDIKELADIQATDKAELLEAIKDNSFKDKELKIKVENKTYTAKVIV